MNFGGAAPASMPRMAPMPMHHMPMTSTTTTTTTMMGVAPRGPFASAAAPMMQQRRPDRTLELVQIASTLDPSSKTLNEYDEPRRLLNKYIELPKGDAVFLKLVECFVFCYRTRGPHEPAVMPNATFYFSRLQRCNSPLVNTIDKVVGYRCCGCRHTTLSPNEYLVGAAQLVSVQFVSPQALFKSLSELRKHVRECPYIERSVRDAVASSSNTVQLADYMTAWYYLLELFAQKKGFPQLPIQNNTGRNNGMSNNRNYPATYNNRPAVGRPLGSYQQHRPGQLKPPPPGSVRPSSKPTSPQLPTLEDEIFATLEHCRERALINNNFGLEESFKSRLVVTDLSKFPISTTSVPVSPLLEVLLQSVTAVQRWTKRDNNSQPLVFFECGCCKNMMDDAFCASTGAAADAADFLLNGQGWNHLAVECSKIRGSIRQKLLNMKARTTPDEWQKQARIVQDNFDTWKRLYFPNQGEQGNAKGARAVARRNKAWRPITWRFLVGTKAAALRTDNLGNQNDAVWQVNKNAFPHQTKDDDVLVGWNGSHKGNQRFMKLLYEFRPIFLDANASKKQREVVARILVQTIFKRGGQFLTVGTSGDIMPPTALPLPRAVWITYRALKFGATVILNPPQVKTGRGSCVEDLECAPQRDLFGTEVVRHNKQSSVQLLKKGIPPEL
ncbi:expressed unknown protein [Seminavis robusta]|uniref:Uncharacterized protein n=1 Tax=Seminavis robusta TaxID=568900 RepID=A0A9N8DED0_9STRA|nr:expressed unknown protein [Seminavis robusta]|eukprot:Sro79_g042840.1 n/a (669) ;mRNA; r:94735-96741